MDSKSKNIAMVKFDKISGKIRLLIWIALVSAFTPALVSCTAVYYGDAAPQTGQATFQVFYDDLSPYGSWVDYQPYGYVWIPDAGPDFSPYLTNGYWVWSDFGWTWRSGYPWGWAAFHYGRWDFNDDYGWFWVPDNVWGPCWVTWRRSEGYYGWAPMRPGISVDASFRGEHRDARRWCFVRDQDFGNHNIARYSVTRSDNGRLIQSSTVITNTYNDPRRNVTYISGPRRDEVQKFTGRRISPVNIQDNEKQGERVSGKDFHIYRPEIENRAGRGQAPAPRTITDIKSVKPAGQNNPESRGGNSYRVRGAQNRREQSVSNSNPRSRGEGNRRDNRKEPKDK